MINWLKSKTLEDLLVYGFLSFLGIGFLIFAIGFFFSFDVKGEGALKIQKTYNGSISEVIFGNNEKDINAWIHNILPNIKNIHIDRTNLFTLYKTLPTTEQFATFRSMAACSIAGFSLIIIAIFVFISFSAFVLMKDIIGPVILRRIKNKNAKQNSNNS